MFKKGLRTLLLSVLALTLVACSAKKPDPQTYDLKLWGSQDDQALLTELVEEFKKTDPDNTYNITLGVVGENDAKNQVLQDPEASADVFAFANDQILEMVDAKVLYEITLNKDKITSEIMTGAIDAVTVDGQLYGIPFTADNGYFLYYDSNFFSEEDVKSLETMLDKAAAAGKAVHFDLANGWYFASFFLGAGNTIGLKDGKPYLDFNNDTGLKVGESLVNIASHAGIQTGGDDPMTAGAQSGKVVAAVSGTWMADMFSTAYGEGFAATKLPTFKVDGVDTQMGSFGGYKVYGVNAFTQHPEQAMALAEFLSNETSQARRFELRKLGPSNLKVAESDAVKEDIALSALAQQGEFSHSQRDVSGSYWDPAAALATDLINGQTDVKALLDAMVQQVMN